MPKRNLKRKQRHRSEPPPSRPSADSGTESGDELEGESAERGGADSAKQGVQNANAASITSKARAALDSHLRSSSSIMRTGSSKRGRTTAVATATATATATTTSAVSFPLTPTSAAGEAAPSSAGSWNQQDKMDEDTTLQSHPRPPPDSSKNDNGPSTRSSSSYSSHHLLHHHHHPRGHLNGSASPVDAVPRTMSHRVENQLIRPRSHFQDQQHFHEAHYYSAHPSPPPIATLTHSPSLSSDRSSVNSPAPTVLPPLNHHPSQFQAQPYRYTASSGAQPGAYHHSHYYPSTVSPPEVFTTPAQTYGHAYGGGYAAPPPPTHVPFHHSADMSMSPSQYSVNPYATTGSLYGPGGHAAGGGSGGFQPVYTDDASTKLSDRVRRRCFNCCTTDTSTWRRSSLNPGKVLCNKCGLFERTHSRPRPDQFPHKRAPLQIPTQNVAHDVSGQQQQQQQQQQQNSNSTQSSQSTHSSSGSPHNLPPTTGHPSLGATYSHPSALPQIQEWLRPGSNNSASGAGAGAGAGSPSGSSSASAGPSSRAHSASSAGGDHRHHPYASSMSASGAGAGSGTASAATAAASGAAAAAAAAGAMRSPQGHSARLAKRSGSVNSDLAATPPPPPSSRGAGGAQNLTPSPSPPPVGAEGTTSIQESSPRVASQSASAGIAAATAESGN